MASNSFLNCTEKVAYMIIIVNNSFRVGREEELGPAGVPFRFRMGIEYKIWWVVVMIFKGGGLWHWLTLPFLSKSYLPNV